MKKFLLTLALLNVVCCYSQDTYVVYLDKRASITFPEKPEISTEKGQDVFQYNDSVAIYRVVIAHLKKTQTPQNRKETNLFYNGFISSAVNAANGQLISRKDTLIYGKAGVEYIIKRQNIEPGYPNYVHLRTVLVGSDVYTCAYWTMDESREIIEADLLRFLNSFTIDDSNDDDESNEGSGAGAIGYKVGGILGQLTFFVLLLALIGGIVVFIVFMSRKPKK